MERFVSCGGSHVDLVAWSEPHEESRVERVAWSESRGASHVERVCVESCGWQQGLAFISKYHSTPK